MRETGQSGLTKFIPTDRLLERFESLEGHPAFQIKPNLDEETISKCIFQGVCDKAWKYLYFTFYTEFYFHRVQNKPKHVLDEWFNICNP